ncbi:MAG: hypothetical protein ACFCGT_21420 [Sandaracinaceae bacterium]
MPRRPSVRAPGPTLALALALAPATGVAQAPDADGAYAPVGTADDGADGPPIQLQQALANPALTVSVDRLPPPGEPGAARDAPNLDTTVDLLVREQVETVTVRMSALHRADRNLSVPVTVEVAPGSRATATGNPVDGITIRDVPRVLGLRVTARLTRPGTYTSTLTAVAMEQEVDLGIRVDFVPTTPSVVLEASPTVRGDTARLVLRETGFEDVRVPAPRLVQLVERVNDTTGFDIPVQEVLVEREGPDGAWAPVGETIAIGAGEAVPLRVRVEGLPDRGRFLGTLRLAGGPQADGQAGQVTFVKRRSWWIALLLLGLGAVITAAIRFGLGPQLERARVERQVLVRRAEARAALTSLGPLADEPRVRALGDVLWADLERLLDAVRQGLLGGDDADARGKRVVTRSRMLVRYAEVARDATRSGVLPDADPDLIAAEPYLRGRVDDPAEAEQALDRVARRAAAGVSHAAVAELRDGLTLARSRGPQQLAQGLEAAATQAATAATALNDGDFVGARRSFEEARATWARELRLEADRRIAAAPPSSQASEAWQKVVDRVLLELGSERELDAVIARFDRAMLEVLRFYGQRLTSEEGDAPGARNQTVRTSLRAAGERLLATEDPLRGLALLDEVQAQLRAREAELESVADARAAAPSRRTHLADVPLPGALLDPTAPPAWTAEPPLSLEGSLATVRSLQYAIAFAGLVLSGWAGLAMLYGGDPDWGTLGDMSNMVLLGAGAQQVSGATSVFAGERFLRALSPGEAPPTPG